MKVSQAPVYRRRRLAAAVVVATLGLGAGFLAGELWGAASNRTSPEASSSVDPTLPTPVITASPDASLPEAPDTTPDVTFDTELHSTTDPDSIWVVVNKLNPLDPLDYEPGDLVTPDGLPGITMRSEAAAAIARLHAEAQAAGADFSASTAYRSRDTQAGLYDGYVARSGQARADTYSARPGYSEHQTGLAVDVHDAGSCELRICFGDTVAGSWLAEHAHEYGFIVRYPEGLTDVTGYQYEPWHLRYVGLELAQEMHRTDAATLEEFFGMPAAPDYAP